MSFAPRIIHLLIVEDDVEVASAIAALALDALARDHQVVIGTARTSEAALDLVQRVFLRSEDRLIVACAARMSDGGSGFAVLDEIERVQRDARVLLLTQGERDDILAALARPIHGIIQKPIALPAVRDILAHLAADDARVGRGEAGRDAKDPSGLSHALAALADAVEAVEAAHDRLRGRSHLASPHLLARLEEAEGLAVLAHRRLLDVERGIGGERTVSRMPSVPVQQRSRPTSTDPTA